MKRVTELAFQGWRRRMQSALLHVETAAGLMGGCSGEIEYLEDSDPRKVFWEAMGEAKYPYDEGVAARLAQKLWDLSEEMEQAFERAKYGPKEEEDDSEEACGHYVSQS